MSSQKKVIMGIGILIVGITVFYYKTRESSNIDKDYYRVPATVRFQLKTLKPNQQNSQFTRKSSKGTSQLKLKDSTSKEKSSNSLSEMLPIPTLGTYKEEVSRDPHRTPYSIIRFANQLTKQMKRAKQSKPHAENMMRFFEQCVQSETVSTVAYLCLRNGRKLSRYYKNQKNDGSFVSFYEEIESISPKKVVENMKLIED